MTLGPLMVDLEGTELTEAERRRLMRNFWRRDPRPGRRAG